ncbi:hypothetical protein ABK040_008924 [Willaertia magna]
MKIYVWGNTNYSPILVPYFTSHGIKQVQADAKNNFYVLTESGIIYTFAFTNEAKNNNFIQQDVTKIFSSLSSPKQLYISDQFHIPNEIIEQFICVNNYIICYTNKNRILISKEEKLVTPKKTSMYQPYYGNTYGLESVNITLELIPLTFLTTVMEPKYLKGLKVKELCGSSTDLFFIIYGKIFTIFLQ